MPESRLTSLPDLPAPDPAKAGPHAFRRVGGKVLVTNDAGAHALLSPEDYRAFLGGTLAADAPAALELADKGFQREQLHFRRLAEGLVERRLLDGRGPSVHTVVVTLRCNFKCLYCHASVVGQDAPGKDMSVETAKRVVDLVFQSPSPTLMIEFQGGEPLLNWPVVKFIVEYARLKNQHHKRALHFGLISNFSLLDDEKTDWLISRGVSFCTSLDGPADLHDRNRVFLGGEAHAKAVEGLERVIARRAAGAKVDPPNAICTITRFSLPRHKEIVDELAGRGLERIQLGPLDPIGFAARSWGTIGYTSSEFVEFYGRALDRVIDLCREGRKVYEKTALILLVRLLQGGQWRFPNADGVSRLAYNFDGSVYLSEEGRLLANEGDEFFRLGDASEPLPQLLDKPLLRASLLAAGAESQPMCAQCAYGPFCTVLPVYNHRTQSSLWGRMPENGWCRKIMGIFDLIVERLGDPGKRAVLESWLQYQDR